MSVPVLCFARIEPRAGGGIDCIEQSRKVLAQQNGGTRMRPLSRKKHPSDLEAEACLQLHRPAP